MSQPGFRILAMAVSALLVVAIVLAAVVLLLREGGNAPIQVLAPGQAPEAANGVPPADGDVRVYVSGAVVNPGVYSMLPGDRLSDALAAAGGATGEAQLASINLALRVVDQGHYHIPILGDTLPPQAGGASSSGLIDLTAQGGLISDGGIDGLIDLNRASSSLLETLPGIECRAAEAIP